MNGFVLDTDVISLFAPGRQPATAAVTAWMKARADRLFISTVSIGEVEAGLAKLRRDGASARAERMSVWLSRFLDDYAERVLPFDRPIAHIYGHTMDQAWAAGFDPGFADAAIAATALHFNFSVVTRNVRHFRNFGAPLINPDELN